MSDGMTELPHAASLGDAVAASLSPDEAARLEDGCGRAVAAFGHAVLQAQVFELCVLLAEPALAAPIGDDDAATRTVQTGLKRNLHQAIRDAGKAGGANLPGGFTDRLDQARKTRNRLAHGYAMRLLAAVLTGRADDVVNELEADAALLDEAAEEVRTVVFDPALGARGLTTNEFNAGAVGMMRTFMANSEMLNGVDSLTDFDEAFDLLLAHLDSGAEEQGNATVGS